jgi:hypothetical protein
LSRKAVTVNGKLSFIREAFIFILFTLTSVKIFSQSESDTPVQLNLKKGVYFSFQQIAKDNPALVDSLIIKERTNGNISMWGGGKYTFELPTMDKAEFKKIKKTLIGISDGESFYISDKFTVNGWQGLTRCLLSGPYIIAPVQGSAAQYTGGGLIPSMIKVGSGFLINLNVGNSRPLTKKVIKELLEKHPDIADKYAHKGDLIELSAEIINEVNKAEKG